jgi:hypothetical protein
MREYVADEWTSAYEGENNWLENTSSWGAAGIVFLINYYLGDQMYEDETQYNFLRIRPVSRGWTVT